jgi:hypothetical protein
MVRPSHAVVVPTNNIVFAKGRCASPELNCNSVRIYRPFVEIQTEGFFGSIPNSERGAGGSGNVRNRRQKRAPVGGLLQYQRMCGTGCRSWTLLEALCQATAPRKRGFDAATLHDASRMPALRDQGARCLLFLIQEHLQALPQDSVDSECATRIMKWAQISDYFLKKP